MDFGIWAGVLELIPLGYQGTTAVCKKPSLRAKERQDRPGLLDNALRANSEVLEGRGKTLSTGILSIPSQDPA